MDYCAGKAIASVDSAVGGSHRDDGKSARYHLSGVLKGLVSPPCREQIGQNRIGSDSVESRSLLRAPPCWAGLSGGLGKVSGKGENFSIKDGGHCGKQ